MAFPRFSFCSHCHLFSLTHVSVCLSVTDLLAGGEYCVDLSLLHTEYKEMPAATLLFSPKLGFEPEVLTVL